MNKKEILAEKLAAVGLDDLYSQFSKASKGKYNVADYFHNMFKGVDDDIAESVINMGDKGSGKLNKSLLGDLRKKLMAKGKTQAIKDPANKVPSVLDASIDEGSKNIDKLTNPAMAGGAIGAAGGAIVDTDQEHTNLLGNKVTTEGDWGDTLSNMAVGAMGGAALGGAGRATTMGRKVVDKATEKALKSGNPFKNINNKSVQEVLDLAKKNLSPDEFKSVAQEAINRNKGFIGSGFSGSAEANDILNRLVNNPNIQDLKGTQGYGSLERLSDRVKGVVGYGRNPKAQRILNGILDESPDLAKRLGLNANSTTEEVMEALSKLQRKGKGVGADQLRTLNERILNDAAGIDPDIVNRIMSSDTLGEGLIHKVRSGEVDPRNLEQILRSVGL